MDTLQWASTVGRREKGEEGSAWMVRSSAPARRFRHASSEEEGGEEPRKYTKGIIIEPLMDTNGHEYHFFMKLCH